MLRPLASVTSQKALIGYVCQQCRHRLAAQRRYQHNDSQDQPIDLGPLYRTANSSNVVPEHAAAQAPADQSERGTVEASPQVDKDAHQREMRRLSRLRRRHRVRDRGKLTFANLESSAHSPNTDGREGDGVSDRSKITANDATSVHASGGDGNVDEKAEEKMRQDFEAIMASVASEAVDRIKIQQADEGRTQAKDAGIYADSRTSEPQIDVVDKLLRKTIDSTTTLAPYLLPKGRPALLTERIRRKQNAPGWGGFRDKEQVKAKASYDSMRKADLRTPPPMVKTAGKQKSWGLEETKLDEPSERRTKTTENDDGFGDSPAYLTEAEVSNAETEESPKDAKKPEKQPAGFLSTMWKNVIGLGKSLEAQSGKGTDTAKELENLQASAEGQAAGQQDAKAAGSPRSSEAISDCAHGPQTDEAHPSLLPIRRYPSDGAEPINDSWKRLRLRGNTTNRQTSPAVADGSDSKLETGQANDAGERLAELHMVMKGGGGANAVSVEGQTNNALTPKPAKAKEGAKPVEKSKRSRRIERGRTASKSTKKDSSATKTEGGDKPKSSPEVEQGHKTNESSDVSDDSKESRSLSAEQTSIEGPAVSQTDIASISPAALSITALNVEQPPVPGLSYGLDRVLFNSGVYQLQDPHSRVYNFDPYLQKIMPVVEFDFNALKEYKTSSQDKALSKLAKHYGKKYVGSTSSMTGTLGHFHYLLSNFRDINLNMLSRVFPYEKADFTNINRAPNAIFLRYKPETETYAIDADKEYDGANVLMMLGKSMEKLLTLPREEYERYRKSSPEDAKITEQEKEEPESYEYTTMGDFLMRSQLDAYDPRLPGTGMFDLKTRAVVSIRMDAEGYEDMLGYEIHTLQGRFESYEREYYDMLRSTMLKYMLQARMGRMDGIFVAYHNVQRIFGFQYLPISEIDRAMHGQVDPTLGDQEFKVSLKLLNEILEMATTRYPGTSMRLHFEARRGEDPHMLVFAEPMDENEIERIQSTGKEKIREFEQTMMGMEPMPRPEKKTQKDVPTTTSSDYASSDKDADPLPTSDASSSMTVDYKPTISSANPRSPSARPSQSSAEDNLRPLFAARIITKSYVNGNVCENDRPARLTAKDEWRLEYMIGEMSPEEKWAEYEDCKTRRRELFRRLEEEEEDDGESGSGARKKSENQYLKMLREMSARGREFRGKLDEMERGREKVVVGRLTKTETAVGDLANERAPTAGKAVENLEEYMDWLYGRRCKG